MSRAAISATGLCLLAIGSAGAAPTFDQPELRSQNGAALLQWAGSGERYEVQHAREPDPAGTALAWATFYRGSMPSAHVSGLRDGVHRFRVRTQGHDDWSPVAKVTVEHHAMALVWPWMIVGAGVFAVTAAYVARQAQVQGRSA